MFDFRYHVASLAAVFIALVVGIVIGVGLSGQGIVEESERERLNQQLDDAAEENDRLRELLEERRAAEGFAEAAYPSVMANRLADKRIAVLFAGKADADLRAAIESAITDADGSVERFKSLRLPIDEERVRELAGDDDLRDVGDTLGREFVTGGETPLWDVLAPELVFQQEPGDEPADAVVVVRTDRPQQGGTAEFLGGVYAGIGGDVPAAWISPQNEERARTPRGMTDIESVGGALGKIRLAVVLSGGDPAEPIEPAEPAPEPGG